MEEDDYVSEPEQPVDPETFALVMGLLQAEADAQGITIEELIEQMATEEE